MRPLGESRFPFSGQKCPVTHGNQSRDSAAFPECVLCLSAGPLTRFPGQAPPAPDEIMGIRGWGIANGRAPSARPGWFLATWFLQDDDGPLLARPRRLLGQHAPTRLHGQWALGVGEMDRTSRETPAWKLGAAQTQGRGVCV